MPDSVSIEIKKSIDKVSISHSRVYGTTGSQKKIELTTCIACIENFLDFVSCVIVWFDVKVEKRISTFLLLRSKLDM